MKALTYQVLLEDLASHGWVVAAIDSTYNARGVTFPDGRTLGGLPEQERGWPRSQNEDEQRKFYMERVAHMSRDVPVVIDQLASLGKGPGSFANRLDLALGVGVFGHSRGGTGGGYGSACRSARSGRYQYRRHGGRVYASTDQGRR